MREPIPFPVHVVRRPDGGDLVISRAHYEHLMHDLFGVLAENSELFEDLVDLLFGDVPEQDPHMPDRPSRDDVLAERIVAALPAATTTIRLHTNPLRTLGAAINKALGKSNWLPGQRDRRAA